MNFLAHLHLAHLADSSLPGNLMADFVRGNPVSPADPSRRPHHPRCHVGSFPVAALGAALP